MGTKDKASKKESGSKVARRLRCKGVSFTGISEPKTQDSNTMSIVASPALRKQQKQEALQWTNSRIAFLTAISLSWLQFFVQLVLPLAQANANDSESTFERLGNLLNDWDDTSVTNGANCLFWIILGLVGLWFSAFAFCFEEVTYWIKEMDYRHVIVGIMFWFVEFAPIHDTHRLFREAQKAAAMFPSFLEEGYPDHAMEEPTTATENDNHHRRDVLLSLLMSLVSFFLLLSLRFKVSVKGVVWAMFSQLPTVCGQVHNAVELFKFKLQEKPLHHRTLEYLVAWMTKTMDELAAQSRGEIIWNCGLGLVLLSVYKFCPEIPARVKTMVLGYLTAVAIFPIWWQERPAEALLYAVIAAVGILALLVGLMIFHYFTAFRLLQTQLLEHQSRSEFAESSLQIQMELCQQIGGALEGEMTGISKNLKVILQTLNRQDGRRTLNRRERCDRPRPLVPPFEEITVHHHEEPPTCRRRLNLQNSSAR